jgi:hypothetical protein
MGFGLRHTALGAWAPVCGAAAGVSVIAIFLLRSEIARRRGLAALQQPGFAGFEIEDILYLIAPVTWAGGLADFVVGAGVGAPLFAFWVARQYMAVRAESVPCRSECPS